MPTYYPRMKELSARGAEIFAAVPGAAALSLSDVATLASEPGVVVLDLRRPEAFSGAHIPGSIDIGAGQNLFLCAGWLLDAKSKIVLVSEQGDDEESRRGLVRVGLGNIAGFLQAGVSSWISTGLPFEQTTQLSAEELREGATYTMLGDLPHQFQTLPKDRAVVTVCGSGYRSSIAASWLAKYGFPRVESLDGGMAAWNKRKFAVKQPA